MAIAALVAASQIQRHGDGRRADAAWAALAQSSSGEEQHFDPARLDGLPDAAQRYFKYAIKPGARLRTSAVIEMEGEFSLSARAGYMPMRAREVLAFPRGFVWRPAIGSGLMRFAGSDGYLDHEAWTRFWALGLVPVARVAGGRDMARSAAGRMLAEAALWTPAAILPAPGVAWEAVDDDTARVVIDHRGEAMSLDIIIAADGRPLSFAMQRWSNANPSKTFRRQAFGGKVKAVRRFGDYTVPSEIEVGNLVGSEDYFPFFKARVTAMDYR